MIRIQTEDFKPGELLDALRLPGAGALVSFIGVVREFYGDTSLWLEHYPGMTERQLAAIAEAAAQRWPLLAWQIVHRVGQLPPGANIVWVACASGHREAAFNACQFIMDQLKTQAPFWKKEGDHWVDAKAQDSLASQRWSDQ